MNDRNPYAAPQTSLLNETPRVAVPTDALGNPGDFQGFRAGALLWLGSCLAMVVAIIMADRLFIAGLLIAFLLGTYLLATSPKKNPGKDWFSGSLVLQLLSPIIVMQSLRDVPHPDWDRFTWYQRIGIWGEFLAVLCVLIGLCQLATWLRFSLLRKLTKLTVILLGFVLLFDAWGRSQSFGYEAILYGLIWGFCGLVPFFILLLVCWICATMVPHYVGLPIKPSNNPNALPSTITIPDSVQCEKLE